MVLGLIRLMTIPDPTQGIFRNEGAGEETSLCSFFILTLILRSKNNVLHSSS